MAEEIKKVISIDTKTSSKSIKQLREEVAGLTAELEDLEIGSTDYTKKLEELVNVQNKLGVATESMQGKTVNAVKAFDSINQVAGGLAGGVSAVSAAFTLFGKDTENLQKTMVKLQAAIAIVQGIGGLKGLGEGILNGVKSFKALSVAMGGATAATGGLSVAMGVLRSAIISTGIGALVVPLGMLIDFAIKASSGIDDLKISISDLKDITDQWETSYARANTEIAELERQRERDLAAGKKSEIQIWKDYAKALGDLVAKALGDLDAKALGDLDAELSQQSDSVTKAYNNLFTDILKSNKYFRKEFKKSGYDTWEEYSQAIQWGLKTSSNEVDFFLSKLNDDQRAAYDKASGIYNAYIEKKNSLMQKTSETYEKIKLMEISAERKAREEAKANYLKNIEDAKKRNADLLKVINDFYEENRKLLLDDEARELDELNTKYQNQLDALKTAKDKELITVEEYRKRLKQINDAYDKEYLDNQNERYRKEINNRINSLEQLRERENRFFDQRQSELDTKYNKTYTHNAGLGNEYKTAGDIKSEKNDRITQSNELLEIQLGFYERDNKRIGELQTTLKESFDNGLITQEEYNNEYARLNAEREANDTAAANAIVANGEKIKAAKKDEIKDIVAAVQGSFAALGSLGDAVAKNYKFEANNSKKSLKEREKAMENYKSIAKISTVFNTASAAMNAYNSMAGIPVVGPVLGGIAAAAAIAMGLLQIKNIENEEISGSDVSSSVSAPSALTQAPVEYTRNLLGNKETDELNQPVKCYVVESDITTAQTKVAVTESNASF